MILPIIKYGHPVLRAKGSRVTRMDEELQRLVTDMLETMYDAHGVGLAAHQVGVPIQLTVIDVNGVDDRPSKMWINGEQVKLEDYMPLVLANPEVELIEPRDIGVEGCLSFPEITADISRASRVRVRATGLHDEPITFEAEGLLARAVQHETDHLHGVLFIDRMNSAAKVSLANRIKRLAREGEQQAAAAKRKS
jgi:peptide deformylase